MFAKIGENIEGLDLNYAIGNILGEFLPDRVLAALRARRPA
jgi:hypothetical protein